jgi:hypothetical protein
LQSFSGAAGLAVEETMAGRSKDDFSLDSPFIEQFVAGERGIACFSTSFVRRG